MNIFLIYSICIYINVGVEAHPRIFLNGIYTNNNKLEKYYVNPNNNDQGISLIDVGKRDARAIHECTNKESREECLRRLKRQSDTYMRRLSKYSSEFDKEYIRESSEYNDNHGFSQDYLDINDLLRSNWEGTLENSLIKQKPRKRQMYKILKPNKFNRFAFDLTTFRRNNRKKKAYESDESDCSSSSESRETIRKNKIAKNKRFQIVDKSTESESGSSEEVRIQKKKPNKKKKDHLMYMQSPSRLYDGRRRLEHFLPKRYHWNSDDIRELSNYWFTGPRGRVY